MRRPAWFSVPPAAGGFRCCVTRAAFSVQHAALEFCHRLRLRIGSTNSSFRISKRPRFLLQWAHALRGQSFSPFTRRMKHRELPAILGVRSRITITSCCALPSARAAVRMGLNRAVRQSNALRTNCVKVSSACDTGSGDTLHPRKLCWWDGKRAPLELCQSHCRTQRSFR